MTIRALSTAAVVVAAILCGDVRPAVAQGNGRPKAPHVTPTSGTTSGTTTPTTSTTTAAATTMPQFGSWLDDASVLSRGDGAVSLGVGHWWLSGMTQTNLPMVGGAVGATDRLQFSAAVPFYRASAPTWSARGMDDVYLSAKYSLLDPTLTVSEVGVAFSPVLEVLSADAGDGRMHFALPVSIEVRRLPFRVYASGGYFTRGAVFGGGAVEWTSAAGVSVTGSLTNSYSTKTPVAPAGVVAARQHADVSIGLAAPLGRSISAFGSIGRSLTSLDAGGTSLALTGGVAFHFAAASATP